MFSMHVPIHVLSKDCQSISGSWQRGWCDQMLLYNVYLKNYPASVDVWSASLLNFALSSAFLFQSALTCLALFAKAATKVVLAASAIPHVFSLHSGPLLVLKSIHGLCQVCHTLSCWHVLMDMCTYGTLFSHLKACQPWQWDTSVQLCGVWQNRVCGGAACVADLSGGVRLCVCQAVPDLGKNELVWGCAYW